MPSGNRDRLLLAFGIATCAFWLSRAVFPSPIPPLTAMPDLGAVVTGVPHWIREMAPELNKPDAEVVAQLRREFLVMVVKAWLFIGGGVLAGVMIAMKKRGGRWLALVLALLVLVIFLLGQRRIVAETGWEYWRIWKIKFERVPLWPTRQLLDLAFCVFSVVFLTRPSTGRRFRGASGEDGTSGRGPLDEITAP